MPARVTARRVLTKRKSPPLTKSRQMANVKSKNTAPELLARRLLTDKGVRYRIHIALPGTPDIYIGRLRLAIFVHGCFWHGHYCKRGRLPNAQVDFWSKKIAANRARDLVAKHNLADLGINAEEWWTCELADFPRKANAVARLYAARSSLSAK